MRNFLTYNKEVLFSVIDRISITKEGDQVVTKYGNRVIKVANVSNRYEIFDIAKYLKSKIELIEKNFKISQYKIDIIGGKQYLQLISDKVEVGGVEFYKSFYILNSSDKSRRLSFNVGLYSENASCYVIGSTNTSLIKKHLKGVTKATEDATDKLNGETFDEQIESMNSIVGHRVLFSKLRGIILGDGDVPDINHRKLDAFKNSVRAATGPNKIELSHEQRNLLFSYSKSTNAIPKELDFYIDAFWGFQTYLRIFNKQDSHIIKNETERIMKITQCSVRNDILESLGI
tara:strand:- start:31 stop:894 length:864 start_codon:yes stop_codon:yes gene_type:complete